MAESTSTAPSTSGSIRITPRGFRFGRDEGWESSAGSVKSSPLSITEYSATRNPKRELAKQHMALPQLQKEPDYDFVTQWRNLKLYRVCNAVPYLLGPQNIVNRIQLIIEQGMEYKGDLSDVDGSPLPAFKFINDKDRALMTILFSASMTEDQCQRTENWTAQGLPVEDNKLRLYKDVQRLQPEVVYVDLNDFMHKAKEWADVPNPANAACDYPDAKNEWADIVAKLREHDVDPAQIDLPLYKYLTIELKGEHINTAIEQIKKLSISGDLARRFKKWKVAYDAQLSVLRATEKENEHKQWAYSKRFSHKHPTGIDVKLVQIEEKKPEEVAPLVAKKPAKGMGKVKKALRILFILSLFAGLISGIIYAMMTSISNDFTKPEGPSSPEEWVSVRLAWGRELPMDVEDVVHENDITVAEIACS